MVLNRWYINIVINLGPNLIASPLHLSKNLAAKHVCRKTLAKCFYLFKSTMIKFKYCSDICCQIFI